MHHIIVIADHMLSDDGTVIGTEGYYIDITETVESEIRQYLAETVPDVIAAREESNDQYLWMSLGVGA